MGWKLTVRAGARVQRSSFDDLLEALEALEASGRELARDAPDRAVDVKLKRFEPSEQVIGRLEVSGPQRFVAAVHAGVDVHGDGSVEAYRGRVRREPIEVGDALDAFAALRRALTTPT